MITSSVLLITLSPILPPPGQAINTNTLLTLIWHWPRLLRVGCRLECVYYLAIHLQCFQIYNNVWTNICVDKPDIDVWCNWSTATCQWYWSSQSSQSQRLCKQVITVILGVEQEDVIYLLNIIKPYNQKNIYLKCNHWISFDFSSFRFSVQSMNL